MVYISVHVEYLHAWAFHGILIVTEGKFADITLSIPSKTYMQDLVSYENPCLYQLSIKTLTVLFHQLPILCY